MNTLASPLNRLFDSLASRTRVDDPLKAALIRKSVRIGLILAAIVAVWLLLADLIFTRVVYSPRSTTPGADVVLQEASASIDDVVRFAQSPDTVTEETAPTDSYPDEIEVAPVVVSNNPFGSFAPKPAPPQDDLGELIRQKQQAPETPIVIRGILGKQDSFLAVLASNNTSLAVRPGDVFMDWQVLAVGRDRVILKKDGKTRTIVWEGNK